MRFCCCRKVKQQLIKHRLLYTKMMNTFKKLTKSSMPAALKIAAIPNGIANSMPDDDITEEECVVSRTTRSKAKVNNAMANGKANGNAVKATCSKANGSKAVDSKVIANGAVDSKDNKVIDTKSNVSTRSTVIKSDDIKTDDSKTTVSQLATAKTVCQIQVLEQRTHNLLPEFPLRNVMDLKLLNINIVDVRFFKAQLVKKQSL